MKRSRSGWSRFWRWRSAGAAGPVVVACLMSGALGDRPAAFAMPVAVPDPVVVADLDPLKVEVLTFGPGTHPFTKFGHNAIRIVDSRRRTDVVYNFGTFSFDSPRLLWEFLQGRLRYWLSRSNMATTVRVYQRENRNIEAQELDLSPAQKQELASRLEVNARPENRNYRYDYFADNCSTRVRDALDAVLHGSLHAGAAARGTMSLRAHALRMSADNLPLYTALLIVLGPITDRPVDEWAEAFLPEQLQQILARAVVGGGETGSPGRRLVKAEQVLFAADRSPVRREPPARTLPFLAAGLLLGLVMALLGRAGSRLKGIRVLFGLVVAVVGLICGGIGCFMVGAWSLTPHAVAYRNENILLFAPFAISLAALGLGTATGGRNAARWTHRIAACALGLAIAACLPKLFPWSQQENGAVVALMLPLWFGITAGARSVTVRAEEASPRKPPLPV